MGRWHRSLCRRMQAGSRDVTSCYADVGCKTRRFRPSSPQRKESLGSAQNAIAANTCIRWRAGCAWGAGRWSNTAMRKRRYCSHLKRRTNVAKLARIFPCSGKRTATVASLPAEPVRCMLCSQIRRLSLAPGQAAKQKRRRLLGKWSVTMKRLARRLLLSHGRAKPAGNGLGAASRHLPRSAPVCTPRAFRTRHRRTGYASGRRCGCVLP